MALMLRYLGIPARVAVGFSSGAYDPKEHVWNVTDREAHAWVEVWFTGYGWLPFDPTPAAPGAAPRETLAGVPAAGRNGPRGSGRSHGRGTSPAARNAQIAEQKLRTVNGFGPRHRISRSDTPALSFEGSRSDRRQPVLLLLAVLAAAARSGRARQGRPAAEPERPARPARCRRRVQAGAHRVPRRPARRRHRAVPLSPSSAISSGGEFAVEPEAFVAAATTARFGPPEEAAAAALTAKRELRALLRIARRALSAGAGPWPLLAPLPRAARGGWRDRICG